MQPRVVVSEPCIALDEPAMAALLAGGFAIQRCADTTALLESVTSETPAAVIVRWFMPAEDRELQMLRLLRRIAPHVPLVVITDGSSICAQRELRLLNPMYLALSPVDPHELVDAVRGATRPKARPA